MLQLGMYKIVASGNTTVACTWIPISTYALQFLLLYCAQARIVDAL